MKRLIVLGLMFWATQVHALSWKDNINNWRTLEISTAGINILLTTGCPCYVYDLTVTSGAGTNFGNTAFQFYWSTVTLGLSPGQTVAKTFNLATSTSPNFNTNVTADRFLIEEVVTSQALYYTFTSSASIRLRWDYLNMPPLGDFYNNGRKPERK